MSAMLAKRLFVAIDIPKSITHVLAGMIRTCRACAGCGRISLKEHEEFDVGLVRVECFGLYSSIPGPLGPADTRELAVRSA
ncbi:MAG: hypothetical protein M3Z22_08705 [Verrucomicrobiota bacterium]|nr:hypothetical protein [Verrucomicrobiota bacterium]